MEEQLWFTAILNHAFAKPVNAIMQALPPAFHPENPKAPINNTVAMEILVVFALILLFLLIRSRLSVEKPGGLQHTAEMLDEFITDQSEGIIGHHSERYTPFLASLFIFIFISNLIGLIPTLESPTGVWASTLGCAVVAFFYYNAQGLREQGLGYFKQFIGPVWWLAPLMLPIEIVSHLARVMSLTIRLRANIFAGDMVTLTFFSLIPILVPVIFLGLHVAVSFLQAYIFTLLTTIYLGLAVSHDH
ncbi:MAG TPA: F0F1 ATP synthase subunit A [Candidatus Angelobacter sp.]|nr:F0F1 ATP synthase subunit A [Candidatus Angelobacter sp.]